MNCLLDFHLATMDTIVHEYASFTDTITHNCSTNVMITESNVSEYQYTDMGFLTVTWKIHFT